MSLKHSKLYGSLTVLALVIVSLSALGLRAFAKPEVPAEVMAAETWLDLNTGKIKALQQVLDGLRSEQVKRQAVLETFGYDYDWSKLSLVKKSPL